MRVLSESCSQRTSTPMHSDADCSMTASSLWAAATARANSYLVPFAHLCRPLLQSPAPSVGLASETQSHATWLHGIQPQTETCRPRAVAGLAHSGRHHQYGSLDSLSAQFVPRSVEGPGRQEGPLRRGPGRQLKGHRRSEV